MKKETKVTLNTEDPITVWSLAMVMAHQPSEAEMRFVLTLNGRVKAIIFTTEETEKSLEEELLA